MRKKRHKITDEALADLTQKALDGLGWTIPVDEDAVARAEAQLADRAPELPECLREPSSASNIDHSDASSERVVPLSDPSGFAPILARAAREGGSVSPEIESVMNGDREAAERELDGRTEDQRGRDDE